MESISDIALVAIVLWGWAIALVTMSRDPNEHDEPPAWDEPDD